MIVYRPQKATSKNAISVAALNSIPSGRQRFPNDFFGMLAIGELFHLKTRILFFRLAAALVWKAPITCDLHSIAHSFHASDSPSILDFQYFAQAGSTHIPRPELDQFGKRCLLDGIMLSAATDMAFLQVACMVFIKWCFVGYHYLCGR